MDTMLTGRKARWGVPQVAAGFLALVNTLMAWQEREIERRRLADMSDAGLKDIGMSRGEALREARKPFWRG